MKPRSGVCRNCGAPIVLVWNGAEKHQWRHAMLLVGVLYATGTACMSKTWAQPVRRRAKRTNR